MTTTCISWQDFLNQPSQQYLRFQDADCVRIESPGENGAVTEALIKKGGGNPSLKFGEIAQMDSYYRGFRLSLDEVKTLDLQFQNHPDDIQIMFDKWQTHQLLTSNRLRRPLTYLAARDLVSFRNQLAASAKTDLRLFLKPRYSSSASGICAYQRCKQRERLIAPIRLQRNGSANRLFNCLKIQTYTKRSDIDIVLGALLPQEMIVESWIPKCRDEHGVFDFRVLMVNNEARHIVARQSLGPITNLHLGNRRASLAQVFAFLGSEAEQQVREKASLAKQLFPRSLYAGVDIMVSTKKQIYVGEVNAFGDLLPGLKHNGESVYEAIIKAQNAHAPSHTF